MNKEELEKELDYQKQVRNNNSHLLLIEKQARSIAENAVVDLQKENTALKQDWEIMQSTISEANDWNDKLVLENKLLKEENAKLRKAISDLEEKWQRFEELSKEMR